MKQHACILACTETILAIYNTAASLAYRYMQMRSAHQHLLMQAARLAEQDAGRARQQLGRLPARQHQALHRQLRLLQRRAAVARLRLRGGGSRGQRHLPLLRQAGLSNAVHLCECQCTKSAWLLGSTMQAYDSVS